MIEALWMEWNCSLVGIIWIVGIKGLLGVANMAFNA